MRRPRHAVLDESGNVVQCGLLEWAYWLELNRGHRVIQQDMIEEHLVSTVFTGLDHQYHPDRRPLWFESMVFEPPEYEPQLDRMMRPEAGFMERYTTLKEALAGHLVAVEWLRAHLGSNANLQNQRSHLRLRSSHRQDGREEKS